MIACPGGVGTFEELFEIITWRQLGLYGGNIVILNVDGYYDPIIEMLRSAAASGFMHPDCLAICRVASNASEAVEMALAPADTTDYSRKIH